MELTRSQDRTNTDNSGDAPAEMPRPRVDGRLGMDYSDPAEQHPLLAHKPYAIFDGRQWLLWYNGRHGGLEQIGLAVHAGEELGFDRPKPAPTNANPAR
jgi:hypothetical protein